jgi:DNA polymerase III subunit delta'
MPKLFNDVLGQKSAVSILSAQLTSGNLSHGYLFLGNEGTGKGFLALEFARYLLCEKHTEDECDNCQRFLSGNHPDFIFIDGTDGIKIDAIREAIERINLSPNMSKYKVLMLSKAENMGMEAANALLKTLEEPPSDSIIIMTAISEKSLPETIISRAQKIKLNTLTDEDIKKILSKMFEDEEIEKVISLAEGSVGEARKLIENPDFRDAKVELFNDVDVILKSPSIIEKFKVIERHDKAKNLRNFFDLFAGKVFETLRSDIADGSSSHDYQIPKGKLLLLSQKILKIYGNLDYNISLRLSMEELSLEYLLYD